MFSTVIRPRISLRMVEERHADAIFELVNRDRDYLREWLPWVDATVTAEDTRAFIRSALEQFAGNHGFTAAIWRGSDVLGVIGTHRIDWLNRRAEVGYWLGRSFQGAGIMTDACRAVVSHLLSEMDLHRVDIRCAVGNHRSQAIPKRLGFVQDGILREAQLLHDRYHDLIVFGMLKQDWKP
jgi:ribosomal-protein-serine acetyltransferase